MSIPTNDEVMNALKLFQSENPFSAHVGIQQLRDLVQPLPQYYYALDSAIADYLLWDYEYEPGHTVALDMAANDHSLDEWAHAKYTRLVPIEGNRVFRDAFDGTEYVIEDECIRPNWDTGSLGCRVAFDDDGRCHAVGNVLLHDVADFDAETYSERVDMAYDLHRIIGGRWGVKSITHSY